MVHYGQAVLLKSAEVSVCVCVCVCGYLLYTNQYSIIVHNSG